MSNDFLQNYAPHLGPGNAAMLYRQLDTEQVGATRIDPVGVENPVNITASKSLGYLNVIAIEIDEPEL